jgi:hypothetical protein
MRTLEMTSSEPSSSSEAKALMETSALGAVWKCLCYDCRNNIFTPCCAQGVKFLMQYSSCVLLGNISKCMIPQNPHSHQSRSSWRGSPSFSKSSGCNKAHMTWLPWLGERPVKCLWGTNTKVSMWFNIPRKWRQRMLGGWVQSWLTQRAS